MPFKPKNSRFYHYDFQIRGRRFHGSCGTEDHEEAKSVEANARVAAKAQQGRKGRYTVSEALGTYYRDVSQHQSYAPSTIGYGRTVLAHFKPATLIDTMTTGDLIGFMATLRGRLANGSANRIIEYLARSIKHMGKAYGAQTPDLDLSAVKVPEEQERVRELTFDEQRRLFEYLRPDLHPFVKFALLTGKRNAEIRALRWDDINYETKRIRFRVKGDKEHRLPMNAEIIALLSALPRSNTLVHRSFVFTFEDRNTGERKPIPKTGGPWRSWTQALTRAEIDNFRFHDLRHTFGTRMLRQTQNLKLVSKLMGHANIETTARYAHVMDDDMADAMQAFSTLSPEVSPEAGSVKHAKLLKGKKE